MPMKDEERIEEEDDRAMRRDFLVQIYEEDRENKIEFYKQIMILSVAGLGFNLSPAIRGENDMGWRLPGNAWELSVSGFLLAILATLLVFYLKSWASSLWSELIRPGFGESPSAYMLVRWLDRIVNFLTFLVTLSFTISVFAAIMYKIP